MKSLALMVIVAMVELCSCEQNRKSMPDGAKVEVLDSTKSIHGRSLPTNYIHTNYTYADSAGAHLIIQNSVPKSGINYTAPTGRKYIYAVFWTRIVNETAKNLALAIDFPKDSFEIPASSGNYMRLLVSSDTMTTAKEVLPDYGLEVKSFLDNNIHHSSSLKRIIYPNTSGSFYVVPLSTRGVGGTLRTGLRLKGCKLIYKVNNKEVFFGKMNLKNLVLQK